VNSETKRINKDVVRSHNEVMLVIGVAEPDSGGVVDSQAFARLKQDHDGDKIGRRLWDVGITLHVYGRWAVNGLRQRLLVGEPGRYSGTLLIWSRSIARMRTSLSCASTPTNAANVRSPASSWKASPPL